MRREIPGFEPLTSATGWALNNCEPFGSTFRQPQFRFDPETGEVRLRGLLKCSAGASTISLTIPSRLRVYDTANCQEVFIAYGVPTDIRFDLSTTALTLIEPGALNLGDYFTISGIVWYIG